MDRSLVSAAADLLRKIAATTLRPAEMVSVAKLQHVFSVLPRVTPDLEVKVSVIGPRRNFEEVKTWHYWDVGIEDEELSIESGGHYYHPRSGGDSFTTMSWSGSPGRHAEFDDYRSSLWMVPDVQSFPDGVAGIDLGSGGYKIEIIDPNNPLLDVEQQDDEVEEPYGQAPEGEEPHYDEDQSIDKN